MDRGRAQKARSAKEPKPLEQISVARGITFWSLHRPSRLEALRAVLRKSALLDAVLIRLLIDGERGQGFDAFM